MNAIRFFISGIPRTKGSSHSFVNPKTKAVIYQHDNPNLKAWQSLVSFTAAQSKVKPATAAVVLEIEYYFPRPKAHFNSKGHLKASAPLDILTKPDIDKLERCILDALTGIAYRDDAQVVRCNHGKFYTNNIHKEPGAWIGVLTDPQPQLKIDPVQTRIPLPGQEAVDDF